jgi:DNA (cytosine-5)-methyltransferase 1
MNELHLFAGGGGGILGGILLGNTTVCPVEIDAYRRQILLERQRDGCLPIFPIWDDIRTFNGRPWSGLVDVVCGGFPCKPYSTASRGQQKDCDLIVEFCRVIEEVRPPFVFSENVEPIAMWKLARTLHRAGYHSRVTEASAQDVGADHIRKRYWLLAYPDDEKQPELTLHGEEVEILPPFRCSVWESYPDKSGMDDGVAYRMDRIRACGDGQVPAVVKLAWETLKPA